MKLVKSLLLGSAAGLAAVAGAQAADLPVRKAAPVEYVRVCSAHGVGYFYIPGTETCLRISGRVRAEYLLREPFAGGAAAIGGNPVLGRQGDRLGWRARGQLNVDARTATAYGTLRTFIRYELTRNSGNYITPAGQTIFSPYTQVFAQTVDLNKAFIQFAGITAGRATSFFDFYANSLNWGGSFSFGSDTYAFDPVVLAYTASFGGGWSATLSLEDPAPRRLGGTFAGVIGAAPGFLAPGTVNFLYAGQRVPEIVGALRVDQAWGSAQLSAALHQLGAVTLVSNPPFPLAPLGIAAFPDTEYGFAIQGGLKINLPFIAPGDQLWLQAAYANGATNYLGFNNSGTANRVGSALITATDAIIDATGEVRRTKGFSFVAAFLHYWTPTVRQAVFGNYASLDYNAAVESPLNPLTGARGTLAGVIADTRIFQAGTNVVWSPVRDLDLGVEVMYKKIDPKGRVVDVERGLNYTVGSDSSWEGRLRIQRDF